MRLDVRQDLGAVDAGEVEVEEDEVGRVNVGRLGGGKFFKIVERVPAVVKDGQAVGNVPLGQRARNDLHVGTTVFDQQDVEVMWH